MARLLHLLLSVANLISFLLKFPFLIMVIQVVIEVIQLKSRGPSMATIEPPYGDNEGIYFENDFKSSASASVHQQQAVTSSTSGVKLEVVTILLVYVGMLMVHLHSSFAFWKSKTLLHLCFYFPLVGAWLFFAIFSYFVQSWSRPLNYIVLIFKLLIHGTEMSAPPPNWQLFCLRLSIWADLVTFILSLVFLFWTLYGRNNNRQQESLNYKPHYNLIRLL